MIRGTKPMPAHLKLVRGNPGKRAVNTDEPKPAKGIPPCPPELTADARKEWQRVSVLLHDAGLLTQIDRAALAAYCQAWGDWLDARRKLAKHGPLVKSPNGYPMPSPLLTIANKAMRHMQVMMSEFGMTPSSRSRLRAGDTAAERDPFDELVDGRA